MDLIRHRMLLSQLATNPPIPANTRMLLHFDDNLTDAMGNFTISRDSGSPTYSTGRPGFGKAVDMVSSRHFGVSYSDYLNLNGDFTIAGWMYSTGNGGCLLSCRKWNNEDSVNGYMVRVDSSGQLQLSVSTGTSGNSVNSASGAVSMNAWHHIAATRASNIVRLFVDGTQVASKTISETLTCDSSHGRSIGAYQSNVEGQIAGRFDGYLDELMVIKGMALWTANFIPPTSAYA